jgi:hypothetical protein
VFICFISFRPGRSNSFAIRRIVRVRASPVPCYIVRHCNPHESSPVYPQSDWDAISPLAVRNHWFERAGFLPFPVPFGNLIQIALLRALTTRPTFFFPCGFCIVFLTGGLGLVSSTGSILDVHIYDIAIEFWVVYPVRYFAMFVFLLTIASSHVHDVGLFPDAESAAYLVAAAGGEPVAENYVVEIGF